MNSLSGRRWRTPVRVAGVAVVVGGERGRARDDLDRGMATERQRDLVLAMAEHQAAQHGQSASVAETLQRMVDVVTVVVLAHALPAQATHEDGALAIEHAGEFQLEQHAFDAIRLFAGFLDVEDAAVDLRQVTRADEAAQRGEVATPQRAFHHRVALFFPAVPAHFRARRKQRLPKMPPGVLAQVAGAEILDEHGSMQRTDRAARIQRALDHREVAVANEHAGIVEETCRESVVVELVEQRDGAITTARGHDHVGQWTVGTGKLVDVACAFGVTTGEAQHHAVDDIAAMDGMSGGLQAFDAAFTGGTVFRITGGSDQPYIESFGHVRQRVSCLTNTSTASRRQPGVASRSARPRLKALAARSLCRPLSPGVVFLGRAEFFRRRATRECLARLFAEYAAILLSEAREVPHAAAECHRLHRAATRFGGDEAAMRRAQAKHGEVAIRRNAQQIVEGIAQATLASPCRLAEFLRVDVATQVGAHEALRATHHLVVRTPATRCHRTLFGRRSQRDANMLVEQILDRAHRRLTRLLHLVRDLPIRPLQVSR